MESDDLFETLKYAVEIDKESLSRQLEEVRSQIDLTMGSAAFSADRLPSASEVINPTGSIYNAPDLNQVSSSLQSPGLAQGEQSFWNNFSASLDQSAEALQLGSSRFTNDMRIMGLNAPGLSPTSPIPGDPSMISDSFFGNLGGALFSGGFDQNTAQMTRGAWQYANQQKLADSVVGFGSEWGFTALGAGMGAAIGAPTGLGAFGTAMTGATIGGIADLTMGVMGRREIEAASLGEGLRGIAKHNFGSISQSEGRRMGSLMQDAVYSYEGRATDMDLDQIQRNVLAFDDAGGFSNVTSADEMEQVLEGVVENTRQFANKFKMKQEEAVQVMAQLQSSMVATTENMGEFSSRVGHLGDVTGLGAAGITNFGMQGVDMFRGTGISASQRFDMALEARTQAERLRYSDPETRQLIADAGGPDGWALRNLERSQRFLMSGQGQLNMASLIGGGTPGDGISDILSSAASFYGGDPRKILELGNNADKLAGALGPDFAALTSVSNAYSLLNTSGITGPGGRVNEDHIISQIARTQGISQEAARSTFIQAQDALDRNPYEEDMMDFFRAREDFIDENRAGGLSRAGAAISQFFADGTTSSMVGVAATGLMDFTRGAINRMGASWRGEEILEGIYLNDGEREAYNELRGSGAFDEVLAREERTPEQLRAARIREGNRNLREMEEGFDGRVGLGGRIEERHGLRGLSDDELALIAAGSNSTMETSKRFANIAKMDIGDVLGDIVALSGEVDESLMDKMGNVRIPDVEGAKNAREELDMISQKALGVNFAEATTAQKNAVYKHYGDIGRTSNDVQEIVRDMRSGDAFTEAETDAEKLDNEAQSLYEDYEKGLARAIRETDIKYEADHGGRSFDELFERAEDKNRIDRAVRKGELSELDTSDFDFYQKQYIERLGTRTEGLSEIRNRAASFGAEARRIRRASSQARATGLDSQEAIDIIGKDLGNRMAVKNVESGSIFKLSDETGMTDFVKERLRGSGMDAQDAQDMIDDLINPANSYEDSLTQFANIASKIDDSTFITEAAARMGNSAMGHAMLKMEGDDVMTRFNQAIGDGVVRVSIQGDESGRYINNDPKDP